MSKSIASESNEGYESQETSGKREEEDEGKENRKGIINLPLAATSTTLTTVSTVPATTDQFMFTPEFRRHFVEFVPGNTLVTLRLTTKGYNAAADAFIDEGVRSGELMVHSGKDFSNVAAEARKERRELVTRVIFFLDITHIGTYTCKYTNLVVVDIPEGVESIGNRAFASCRILNVVSFPTTLKSIGEASFNSCRSLDNVNLLHTNLKQLNGFAFDNCSNLTSMTLPNSLQTLGDNVFFRCSKLVPSSIDINDEFNDDDVTSEVVAHLRSPFTSKIKKTF